MAADDCSFWAAPNKEEYWSVYVCFIGGLSFIFVAARERSSRNMTSNLLRQARKTQRWLYLFNLLFFEPPLRSFMPGLWAATFFVLFFVGRIKVQTSRKQLQLLKGKWRLNHKRPLKRRTDKWPLFLARKIKDLLYARLNCRQPFLSYSGREDIKDEEWDETWE